MGMLAPPVAQERDLDRQPQRTMTEAGAAASRDDASLLRDVQCEDEAALAALYDRHAGVAYGLAHRITGDAGAAEDALQEAFVSLWRQAPRFDASRGQVRAWLLTIVHHKAVDIVRRRANRPERTLPDGAEEFLEAHGRPDEIAEASLDARAVREAVSRIPADQRKTVEMAYFMGMTHVEIAEAMGVPVGTVKSRLRIAMDKMREQLRLKVIE
jgi:RNA polymerase sigma-70 factor (ECF subfamily)